ncbi:YegS/Rv2252/BmrU family lipid kinase [Chitinophaga oryziterrae]|uniref:YegS/Rv2252/BmrU family lipid kinase n=1 Tax=Chitinophaga oryziterrae TaxID=1031224 RepID=A0A6N8J915_9BACT|nr:YegS/Rv2252/BmrU family lipid kinase [Chitinophaga oryziterrae]MVT41727.1 YegS/Rv2252/BmrU family lipid kinase [Chitinophaga oryziterrae]
MRLLFVINPRSGGKKKADPETMVENYFREREETIQIFRMNGQSEQEILLHHQINQFCPDCVIAAGGDGTVKMVAEQLLNTSIPMGILPTGSANGMAMELGIPAGLEAAMDIILQHKAREIDVIRIEGKGICIHLGDIGLNALLVKNFEQRGIRGKLGYILSSAKTFMQRQRLDVQIENMGMHVSRKAFMIVLANARMYGTGACINPDGDLSDGLFEVVIIRQLSLKEIFKMMVRRSPFDQQKVEIIHAKNVTITTGKKSHFQIDGEYLGKIKHVKAAIVPKALKILIP